MKNRAKRALCMLLALSLLLTACGGGGASAATMRLRKTEGTVRVRNGEGEELETRDDLSLYSGYDLRTREESYAWVDLDEVKLTKLDQDSRAEIEKEGKSLTIRIRAGSLFFNVTEPLEEDETMTIRVSAMAVGIRGTCGWVEVLEDGAAAQVWLLEGKVRCEAGDNSEIILAGETALMTEDGDITVTDFSQTEIPAYVMEEVEDDEELLEDIPESADGSGSAAPPPAVTPEAPSDGGAPGALPGSGRPGTPSGGTVNTAPPPAFVSWEDAGLEDHPMEWGDVVLSTRMGLETGIRGTIMLSDVWELTELSFPGDRGGYIEDISALAELKNLTTLGLAGNEIRDISPLRELTNLTSLDIGFNEIWDISPLRELTNLTSLDIGYNEIRDFSPLGGLTNLTYLDLGGTRIRDLSPLSSLINLTELNLRYNKIADVSPLSGLWQMNELMLNDNQIEDVSPLGALAGLDTLGLTNNPVTDYSPVEFVPHLEK